MNHSASVKKYTLLAVTLASFLTPFMGSAVNLAIPSIGEEYGSSTFLLSWVLTSYLLSSAAFLVPFGRLADITGRKRVFMGGLASFSIFSFLCGLAWSTEALIAFRVLQGVGSAMIFGTGIAMLTSVFEPSERGKVLGVNVATVYIGLSLGPVLGGALNQNLGWKSIFYFSALIGIIALLTAAAKLKGELVEATGEKFDVAGSILYIAGLVSLIYGISSITTSGVAKYSFALGILIILIFIAYERRIKQPVLHLHLFSGNVTFAFSNLAALINYSATFAVTFLLSLELQIIRGYTSQGTGLILLSQPIIMAVLSPFAGHLSDRVQPRAVASWGMGITTVGLLFFSFMNLATPLWMVMSNLALLGTGFALFSSPNTNAVMGSVEKRYYGIASSTLGTMRLTGQAVSMAIVTLTMVLYVGNAELSPENADLLIKGIKTAFRVFTLICFAGIFASLARGKINTVKEKEVN